LFELVLNLHHQCLELRKLSQSRIAAKVPFDLSQNSLGSTALVRRRHVILFAALYRGCDFLANEFSSRSFQNRPFALAERLARPAIYEVHLAAGGAVDALMLVFRHVVVARQPVLNLEAGDRAREDERTHLGLPSQDRIYG
jgi:hypothetical protein